MKNDSSSLTQSTPLVPDAEEAAREAGLRYVSDEIAGIKRRRAGKGFFYKDARGERIKDASTLARIKHLAIPPAYQRVWICPFANGHIQATGFDERGRKQYKYHEQWRAARDENKYQKMIAFGKALPRIRRAVARDLKKRGLPREKVLAAVVQLLEETKIRVGNEEYARSNKSFGLTTLRNRHAEVQGARVTFDFKGKSGIRHHVDLKDATLSRVVSKLQDLPGQELFQYVSESGEIKSIGSSDVNEYLRQISNESFSAKDFRTWAGTVLAALTLQKFEPFDSPTQAKKNVVSAIKIVAQMLGNTPSVCRKCYVHPAVLEAYMEGDLTETMRQWVKDELRKSVRTLEPDEAALLVFLERRLHA